MERATAENEPSPFWVHASLVAVQLGFASHHVASKLVLRDMHPGALAVVRAVSAALILFTVHLATRGLPRVPLKDLPLLALCGVLGIAANQLLFFEGLSRSTAINASILVTTIPVFTLLVAIALRREVAKLRTLLGVGLALSGVLYLLGVEAFSVGSGTALGDALIVANAFCYGSYLVLVGPLVRRHGSMTTVVWLFFFGALWVLPYGAADLAHTAAAITPRTWALVAWVVLVATIFTYLVNGWALRYAKPSVVAIYIYLQPVAASVLAVILLGERITPRVIVAAILVFAGIYLVTRRVKKTPATER